jgi:hypothetical protein
LYDDGWRLEKISLTYKAEPWPLSSEEQSKITAHDNDLKAQEAEWSRIVTESKRPTRTVATIDNVKRGRCSGRKYSPVSVQITDADIGSVCQVV